MMSVAPNSQTPSSLIDINGVYKQYGTGVMAVSDMSLKIEQGQFVSFLGPSGCGKSTALRMIAGLESISAGDIHVNGHTPGKGPVGAQDIGFVFQEPTLMPWASVFDNVYLPLRLSGLSRKEATPRVDEVLTQVGLSRFASAYPRELSGGMARRVALARALALDPPLMIYDEPLTGLDPIASGVIMSLIQRLNHSLGLTSIIVSHHVHETLPICDQVIAIANGGIVFQGSPAALESSQDPLLRQFLHGEPDGPIPFDAAPRARVA